MTILIVLPIQRSLEKRLHVDIEANSCSLLSCKCQLQLTLPALMDCGQCIVEFFGLFNHHHASCFSPSFSYCFYFFPPLPPYFSSTLTWLPINLFYSLLVYCKYFSFNQQVSTSLFFYSHYIPARWSGRLVQDRQTGDCGQMLHWQPRMADPNSIRSLLAAQIPSESHITTHTTCSHWQKCARVSGLQKKGCQLFLGGH